MKGMPKLNVAVLGYALFVAINATSLWGGVFPFFPHEFHTPDLTIRFFMSQALAYCATLFLTMVIAYRHSEIVRRTLVLIAVALTAGGAVLLIAAMYLDDFVVALVTAGGMCLGMGCGGFAMAWQRYFSALPSTPGIYYLLVGTMLGAPVFFALYLVPSAVTVYLSPIILIPVCGLCAILATRTVDFGLPQLADVPASNPKVYRQTVRDYWKSAVGVGAVGFVSGAVRAAALSDPLAGDATNIFSMVGSLAAAGVLLIVWRRRAFQFDFLSALKVIFPCVLTCLLLVPLLRGSLFLMAGVLYLAFSVVALIMLLQCAQASRDRGINPAFIFGFYGGIVYFLQDLGFVFGFWTDSLLDAGFGCLAVIALVGAYVLAMAFALQYSGGTVVLTKRGVPDRVEFVAREGTDATKGRTLGLDFRKPPSEGLSGHAALGSPSSKAKPSPLPSSDGTGGALLATGGKTAFGRTAKPSQPSRRQTPASRCAPPRDVTFAKTPASSAGALSSGRGRVAESERLRDRVSKDCLLLQSHFKLSNRETEVAELVMRGNSVSSIADTLVISENTVRTHTKHIYAKLGIHKRQEMLDLVRELVE